VPNKAPRICGCGHRVPYGVECECQRKRNAERKARFDATRPSARQRGYDTEWQRERDAYLKVNSACRHNGCGAFATIVHHIQPHKGNRALFWNRGNWLPVCQPCHNGPLQAAERRGSR